MPQNGSSRRWLALLVFSQFAGTSLWFAGNAVIDKISASGDAAAMTAYVQSGFLAGTFLFALFTVADRFPAKKLFFFSSLLAALANAGLLAFSSGAWAILVLRLITGFFLAGIYPVGMKIAADVFPQRLGRALGLLVGALVLGTAFPHLVRSQLGGLNWKVVILASSLLAVSGGLLVFIFMPSVQPKAAMAKPDFSAAFTVFRRPEFRSAAFGYFGHMWEVYAFWSILPLLLSAYNQWHQQEASPSGWSFLTIGIGSLGCVMGGIVSQRWGSKRVAFSALLLSFCCCLLAPLLFRTGAVLFHTFLLVWGFSVVADSPQFSALVAGAVEGKVKGTALTIVTCLGFAITIISIQWLKTLFATQKEFALWLLAPGPFFGLLALAITKKASAQTIPSITQPQQS